MAKIWVEVVTTLADQKRGTRVEVEQGPAVDGMINGGYWKVVAGPHGTPEPAPAAPTPAARRLKGQTAPESTGGTDTP